MKSSPRLLAVLFLLSSTSLAQAEGVDSAPNSHFRQVLAHVYQSDPRLLAEREALKALDQRVAGAYSGFRPTASGEIDYGRRTSEIDDSGFVSGPTHTRTLIVEQPLFSGFGTLSQFKAAKERVLAGRARLTMREEQVLLEAAAAYLDLAEKQKLMELNYTNHQHIRGQFDGAKKRFSAGDGTRTEVAQSESRLAQAESTLALAQAEWDKAYVAYERSTGMPAESVDFPEIYGRLPATLEETKRKAMAAPEVLLSSSEEKVSAHEIDVASSSIWPALSLRGSLGDEQGTTAAGSSTVRQGTVTLNLHVPLYQGGAEYARVREAKNNRIRQEQESVDTQRAATERAAQLWYSYQASGQVVRSLQHSADAAAKALSGVSEEQREGVRTLLDVLDARSELLARQVSEVQAQKSLRLDAYRLMAATGELTAERLMLPTRLYDPGLHYEDNATRWAGF